MLKNSIGGGIHEKLNDDANSMCKRDKDGNPFIHHNMLIRLGLGTCVFFGILMLLLAFMFISKGEPESLRSVIVLGYGFLSLISVKVIFGEKRLKIKDNRLCIGRRGFKSVTFSELKKLCIEIPPVIYNDTAVTFPISSEKIIRFSLNTYYGSKEFFNIFEKKIGVKFQPEKAKFQIKNFLFGILWFIVLFILIYFASLS